MPGLLRGLVRTAAVAGTATAVSNRVSRRQARRWAADDVRDEGPSEPDPRPLAAAPDRGDGSEDTLAQLERLGKLRDAGVLSDAEFADQKRRILGS